MSELIAISRARQRLPSLVREVAEEGKSFGLVRRGRLDAVLISAGELEGLFETVEILADPALRARIRRSLRELDGGRLIPWSEAKARWRKRQRTSASRRPR